MEVVAELNSSPERIHPCPMAKRPRYMPLGCPPAISIHDDRDMSWDCPTAFKVQASQLCPPLRFLSACSAINRHAYGI
jgi:hypothetical protein